MTVTANNKTDLVVPLSVRRKAGIKSGTRLEFKVLGGVIHIIPRLSVADAEYTPAQRRMVDARLAKSDEDIRRGRVHGPFGTAEAMAASIEHNIRMRKAKKARTAR